MNPSRASWLRPRWLFNRRAMKALLWTVLLVAAAVGANIVGIYLVGSVANWERWLAATAGYFLVWRMCLYGATAYGWSGCAAGCWRVRPNAGLIGRRDGACCAARSPASPPLWRWKPAC